MKFRFISEQTISVLVVCLLAVGCDLFTPREPEDPTGGGGTWLQPESRDRVVENIRMAVSEMNVRNYSRSFSSNFVFEPTARAAERDGIWSNWDVQREEAWFTAMQAATSNFSGHNLQFTDASWQDITANEARYEAGYTLTIFHSQETVPESEFAGRMVLDVGREEDGLWHIVRWTDREIDGHSSWSDLKAAFMR